MVWVSLLPLKQPFSQFKGICPRCVRNRLQVQPAVDHGFARRLDCRTGSLPDQPSPDESVVLQNLSALIQPQLSFDQGRDSLFDVSESEQGSPAG